MSYTGNPLLYTLIGLCQVNDKTFLTIRVTAPIDHSPSISHQLNPLKSAQSNKPNCPSEGQIDCPVSAGTG